MSVYVAEGYDINLVIEAQARPQRSKKPKINGFWLFLTIRKEQLEQSGDQIIFDQNALRDKIAQEWDNLGRRKQKEFKLLAK